MHSFFTLLDKLPKRGLQEALAYVGGAYAFMLQWAPTIGRVESILSVAALATASILGTMRIIEMVTDKQIFPGSDND